MDRATCLLARCPTSREAFGEEGTSQGQSDEGPAVATSCAAASSTRGAGTAALAFLLAAIAALGRAAQVAVVPPQALLASRGPRPMARLFVLFARDAHEALVLRKGPSAWYHLIQWDTRRDTFLHGAWIRGRIYEEKCDVSPDGKLFVYCTHQGRRLGTSHSDAWTAVSRPPWLHALALWRQGTTYGGGGRFVGNRDLVLRGVSSEPHPDHPFRPGSLKWTSANPEVHRATDDVPGSDWCGRDQRGRVVHAVGPRLFVRSGSEEIVLADFGDARPDPTPAPAWATAPL